MIDVKAAKRPADPLPSAAQVLSRSEQDAPLSLRWPGLILAALAVMVAFVQSLAGKSEAAVAPHEGAPSPLPPDAVSAAIQEPQDPQARPAEIEPEDETGSIGAEDEQAIGSGQPGPAVPGLPDYLNIDSPAFDFEQIPLRVVAPITPSPFGEDAKIGRAHV